MIPTTFPVPNPPGSEVAGHLGCLCSPVLNCAGAGASTAYNPPVWWVRADCPLHGAANALHHKRGPVFLADARGLAGAREKAR